MNESPTAPDSVDKTEEVRQSIRASRSRGRLKWVVLAAMTAAIAAAAVWWFQRGDRETAYRTAAVDRGDIVITATATGTLEPKSRVTVGAEISGQIEEVLVEQNDQVEKGQVLARFDTERLENSLAQAEASLAQARASLETALASREEAKLNEQRVERLHEKGAASDQALEQARAEHKRAAAQVESARASIRQARATVSAHLTDLEKATIVSPVDGVVLSRKIEPGNTVAASFQAPELFVLAEDLSEMELHVDLDEADVGLVEADQSATFTVDAWPDRTFDATVQLVALNPTITNNVVTYTTELEVDNEEGLLRPGMTATATIHTGRREDVLRVPNTALRFVPPESGEDDEEGFRIGPPHREDQEEEPDRDTVYRLVDGQPRLTHVQTGRTDGRYTEIRAGDIAAGDLVVTGITETDAGRDSAGSEEPS